MPKSDTFYKNLKATGKRQKFFDGGGLFLEVTPSVEDQDILEIIRNEHEKEFCKKYGIECRT